MTDSSDQNNKKTIKVIVEGEAAADGTITGGDNVKIMVGKDEFVGDTAVDEALKKLKPAAGTGDGTDGTDAAGDAAGNAGNEDDAASRTTSGVSDGNLPPPPVPPEKDGDGDDAVENANRVASTDLPPPPVPPEKDGDGLDYPAVGTTITVAKGDWKDRTGTVKSVDKERDMVTLQFNDGESNEFKWSKLQINIKQSGGGGGRTRAKRRRPKRTGTKKKKRTKRQKKKGRKTKKC